MDMNMDTSTGMAGMTGMDMATATSTGAMSSSTSSMGGMDMGGGMGGMDMGTGSCKITMLWNWNTIDACFLSQSWQITSRGMFAGSCIGVICLVLSLEFLRRVAREYDAFIIHRARLRARYLSPGSGSGSGRREKFFFSSLSSSSQSVSPEREHLQSGAGAGGDCCHPETPAGAATPAAGIPAGIPAGVPAGETPAAILGGSSGLAGPNENEIVVRPSLVEHTIRSFLHMLQFAVAYFVMLLAMYFNGYVIICIFIGAFLGAFLFSWEPLVAGRQFGNDPMAATKCCG